MTVCVLCERVREEEDEDKQHTETQGSRHEICCNVKREREFLVLKAQ